jgi:outer membrane receptor for ferrienterochelin and colicins
MTVRRFARRASSSALTRASVALLAASLATLERPARADDMSQLEELLDDTVVTTASKTIETGSVAPATSSILTAEDLHRYGIHSLDESIDFLSLGMFTANPLRESDIGGRGVILPSDFGDHVTLLVNGHAVNEPLYGGARFDRGAAVPFELIDHIEVILGPGSVLYGSSAMLGVINIITKRAKDFDGVHLVAETEVLKSYRTAASVGHSLTLFGRPLEITGEVEYYEQHGPAFDYAPQRVGTDQTRLGYDAISGEPMRYTRNGPATGVWGGTASHVYYSKIPSGVLRLVSGNLELTVAASTAERGNPYWGRVSYQGGDFDDPLNFVVDRRAWADLKYHATVTELFQVSARLYADTAEHLSSAVNSSASGCIDAPAAVKSCLFTGTYASRWAGAELQGSFDWLGNAHLVTMLGVDARAAFVAAKGDAVDADTGVHFRSSYGIVGRNDRTLGAYAQQTWAPTRWLDLNAGTRIDLGEHFSPVGSPRAALSVKPWRGGTLKAIYAEAFRYPSWVELDLSYAQLVKPLHLVPERVQSMEASTEQKFGTHRILFGAFRSRWQELVGLHLLTLAETEAAAASGEVNFLRYSGFSQFRNLGVIDNFGFDALLEGSFVDARLRYGATITSAVARVAEPAVGEHAVTVAPHTFGNARISYDLRGNLPTLGLALHWMSARPVDRAFDGGFPGLKSPPQVELRATASGLVPFAPGLSYRVSANYALASRGPYAVGPGEQRYPGVTDHLDLVQVDQFRATVGLSYEFGRSQ